MALIPQRTLKQLFDWNQELWASVSRDPSIPQSVKSMIYQHLKSAWVPDALAVVISPLNGGQNNPYLKRSAFDLGGFQYYYPSVEFWTAHAMRSHPPEGQGCDPAVHASFLTEQGPNAEFIYAVVTKYGDLKVQDAEAFNIECAFYDAGNGE